MDKNGKWKPVWTVSTIIALALIGVGMVTSAVTLRNTVETEQRSSAKTDAAFSENLKQFTKTIGTLTTSVNDLTEEMARRSYLEKDVAELKERVLTLERK